MRMFRDVCVRAMADIETKRREEREHRSSFRALKERKNLEIKFRKYAAFSDTKKERQSSSTLCAKYII